MGRIESVRIQSDNALKIQKLNTMSGRASLRKLQGPAKGGCMQEDPSIRQATVLFHCKTAVWRRIREAAIVRYCFQYDSIPDYTIDSIMTGCPVSILTGWGVMSCVV